MAMKVTLDWNLVLDRRVLADRVLEDRHDSFPEGLDIRLVAGMGCLDIRHLVTFQLTYLVTCDHLDLELEVHVDHPVASLDRLHHFDSIGFLWFIKHTKIGTE